MAKMKTKPTIKLDPADVERLAEQGLTLEQIASSLGVSYSTLNRRKQETEDLEEALKRGREKGIAKVTNALFENAMSGNVTAQIFYLKCRAGWSTTDKLEVSGGAVAVGDGLKSVYESLREVVKETADREEDKRNDA